MEFDKLLLQSIGKSNWTKIGKLVLKEKNIEDLPYQKPKNIIKL